MKSTNSLINQLLDILNHLETNGNPHPDFLKATKLIADNYKLSELFILIRRSFSGDKPEQLSYWLYSSKQSETPEKGKKHNIIEISYSESSVLKSIREKKDQVIFLNQDNHFSQMINNMKVVIGAKIDVSSKYCGICLNDSNDKDGFIILKNDERVLLNSPEWISVKKIICLMIDKIFHQYDESNKIKNILSETAFKLLDIQQHNNHINEQDDVLQGVLDVTRKTLKAETGALFLVDSSGSSLVLERISSDTQLIYANIPQVPTYLIRNYDPEVKGKGVTPWVWFRKQPFNARDYNELKSNSEGHHKGNWDNLMYGYKAPNNFKCAYMTPLLVKDECLGVLKFENRTKDAVYDYFDQADERTIDIIAQFIANLIISQRIEKNRYDLALPEISTTLVSSFGKPDFYDELLEKSRSILNAKICSLFLLDKDQSLELKAIVGVEDKIKQELKDFSYPNYLESHGLTPWILRENKSFNSRTFADLEARSEGHHWGKWDDIVYHGKPKDEFKSLYSIPLKIGKEPIGVLKVEIKDTIPFYFTESDERLFDLIGRLVAVAVKYERDLLYGDMLKAAEIGFLSSGIAHQFNTFLARFQGIAENISHDSKESKRKILKLLSEIKKADDMIKNFRQIRDRRQDVELFDIDKLIRQLIESSEQRFSINSIKLIYENNDIYEVLLNPSEIQTMIVNLLSNAFDSVNKRNMEKYIKLKVFKFDNNKMIIECEDSGEGISDDNSPGIFVPFHSTKGEYGMGIGLYWVDRLVKNMGGSIEVINKNELGGATFKVILPVNYKIKEL